MPMMWWSDYNKIYNSMIIRQINYIFVLYFLTMLSPQITKKKKMKVNDKFKQTFATVTI